VILCFFNLNLKNPGGRNLVTTQSGEVDITDGVSRVRESTSRENDKQMQDAMAVAVEKSSDRRV